MAQSEARAALAESRPLPEFQAELSYEITYNAHGFWSLYTQVREHTLPGQDFLLHLGSEQRISRRPGRLFPPPQRLETEAFIRRGGGGPAQGTGGDQPLPGKPAAGSAASLQSPELLSDGGRPGLLLPHVRHRSGTGGDPGIHPALRRGHSLPSGSPGPVFRHLK